MYRTSTVGTIGFFVEFDLLSLLHLVEVGRTSEGFEIKEQLTGLTVRLNPAPSRAKRCNDFGYAACRHRLAPSGLSRRVVRAL